MVLRRLLVLLFAIALLAGACGGDDDDDDATDTSTTEVAADESTTSTTATTAPADDEDSAPASGDAVTISGFSFNPDSLAVTTGTTVTWSNKDGVTHTVTSGTPEDPDGTFEEQVSAGSSVEITLDEAGRFTYFCAIHNTMRGEIVVS